MFTKVFFDIFNYFSTEIKFLKIFIKIKIIHINILKNKKIIYTYR
jgi:hypothetical protein